MEELCRRKLAEVSEVIALSFSKVIVSDSLFLRRGEKANSALKVRRALRFQINGFRGICQWFEHSLLRTKNTGSQSRLCIERVQYETCTNPSTCTNFSPQSTIHKQKYFSTPYIHSNANINSIFHTIINSNTSFHFTTT
jgi:hypothetical protein